MKICHHLILAPLLLLTAVACSSPKPGPDKTLGGAVLGAAWGAGSGAVIGNQLFEPARTGEGMAIGAGFGAVAGAASGLTYDVVEDTQIEHERQLSSIRIQNMANSRELALLQAKLDQAVESDIAGGVYQVFFDDDATSMRSGAVANLEVIAESIKTSPRAHVINVVGHTDDSGDPKYNARLAEARARAVAAYLAARGISVDKIQVRSFGAERPIASNVTPVGRQLNRRVDVYISRQADKEGTLQEPSDR